MLNLALSSHAPSLVEPDPLFPDEAWLRDAQGDQLCAACSCLDRTQYPRPLDVVLSSEPQEQVLDRIETTQITIFRRDFIDALSNHLTGFVLGGCLLSDGSLIEGYCTCYSPSYVLLRGNRQSRYAICPECGAIISELGNSPKYVLERDITESLIYQDVRCQLLLADQVIEGLDTDEWLDFYVDGVSVRESPADGQTLPGDPP